MKILITGSSGFVGRYLTGFFIRSGYEVTGIDEISDKKSTENPLFRFVQTDTTAPGDWQKELKDKDAVINLAGTNIFNRWTDHYKKLIYDSRILTTKNIVDALPDNSNIVFISTSALGFYGDRGNKVINEKSPAGSDFLAKVCIDWENEANRAKEKGIRVVTPRFSVVLGKNGGALSKMVPVYKMFVGGPLGDGTQWFSWIQINDLINAMQYVLEHTEVEGAVNFCSPRPVRNKDFSRQLAKTLGRPALFRVPAFMLRIVAGELGGLVLNSQRGYPEKLLAAGFQFEYPEIDGALLASIK